MAPDQLLQTILQLTIAVAGSSALAGWIGARATRRKIAAEADKSGADASAVLADSALGLLEPWIQQVDRLSARLQTAQNESARAEDAAAAARRELSSCRSELDDLRGQLAAARATIERQAVQLAALGS